MTADLYPYRYSYARKKKTLDPGPPVVECFAFVSDGAPTFAALIEAALPAATALGWYVEIDGILVGFTAELSAADKLLLDDAYAAWDPDSE